MKVLLTGATGLVGQEVGQALVRAGHEVFAVTRNRAKAEIELAYPAVLIEGDLATAPLVHERLHEVEAVIHLLGEGVADGRWSPERKARILESRRAGTQHLWTSLRGRAPEVVVSASAIGYYGDRGEESLTEDSAKGTGFLADVCDEWERAVQFPTDAVFASTRKLSLRIGMVLAAEGGALAKLIPIYQTGAGGVIGNGQAWMSWIHLQDLVRLLLWSLTAKHASGVVNATAPNPVRNREFTKALVTALDSFQGPPVPKLALKALYGEMSEVVLASQKVTESRAAALGFTFQYQDILSALTEVCQFHRGGYQVLTQSQYLPYTKEAVFPFFAAAENLEKITPPLLNFAVKTKSTEAMGAGTLIDYVLKIRGVPAKWRTLIEDWNPPHEFVDTQLKGPYKYWHHRHRFEDLGTGVLMRDRVRYKLPLGLLGQVVAGSFVRGDVEKIFAFRRKYLHDHAAGIFGR
ncbi:MAG: TIGR01777 family oxidoreductase [Bdellovibrionaceae bacterium]|nr:TIGR01777 family oxidoreductase [Pseudobdellovibrionaceae bacterium]